MTHEFKATSFAIGDDGVARFTMTRGDILNPLTQDLRNDFVAMLDQGAIDEVTALRARGLDPALPAMRAIGVREIGAWCDGLIDRASMIAQAQAATLAPRRDPPRPRRRKACACITPRRPRSWPMSSAPH